MRKRVKINHPLTKEEVLNFIFVLINKYKSYFPDYIIHNIEPVYHNDCKQLRVIIQYQFINYKRGLLSLTINIGKKILPNISDDYIKYTILEALYGIIYHRNDVLLRDDEQKFILDNIELLKLSNMTNFYELALPYFSGINKSRIEGWLLIEKAYNQFNDE